MIETLAFRTQARTIDHLGREQIADCPTAISELWKNAYDAYARNVSLHIFDDPEPVAAIFDDGHGMSYEEFVSKWLVVGTESKFSQDVDDEEDRDGLPKRSKQGQKGIGRLSSANLGPLLLLISKRKNHDFVAALIDWRVFENPYLLLSDIEVPVTQFREKEELFSLLPELFERLKQSVLGGDDPSRSARLKLAWDTYDRMAIDSKSQDDQDFETPSKAILNTIIKTRFDERHVSSWPLWREESEKGTALLVSGLNYDLRVQLPNADFDGSTKDIRDRFASTLASFTDPYVDPLANEANAMSPEIKYRVVVHSQKKTDVVVSDDKAIVTRPMADNMEHVLSGTIDSEGVFRGQIKAFGEWRLTGDKYVIYPPKDYKPPKGPTTYLGDIGLFISSFEQTELNTTLEKAFYREMFDIPEVFKGLFIYRDGLRVLPYGRIDNDFFQIERRRSSSAGREFWNARRMFGHVTLSRSANPNLKDKAGREGFIDNRSAKALRVVVENILKRSAYDWFGSVSELRGEVLPDIREQNTKLKAEQERKELAKKNAKKFRSSLKKSLPKLESLLEQVDADIAIQTEPDLVDIQNFIADKTQELSDCRIPPAPSRLGSSEEDYRAYRAMFVNVQSRLKQLTEMRSEAIERIKPTKPEELAERQVRSLAARLQNKLKKWRTEIEAIQSEEQQRIDGQFDERNKAFHALTMPLIIQVKEGRLNLDKALLEMESIYDRLNAENEDVFQPYINALELMRDNINIELVASQGVTDNIELKDEVNKLNQLAQLGVTVEIIGHELNSNERMIREGIRQLTNKESLPAVQLIEEGFESLSHQLEFLSPLKMSGNVTRRNISGGEIHNYLLSFFEVVSRSRGVTIRASDKFKSMVLYDQPSRILPVFVNLVNNSIYWLVTSKAENPVVELSVIDNKVVVSDNGPGIDPLDQESLFKLFFTRKTSGGRGVGLYLCKANLLASGHTISYVTDKKFMVLNGANFVLEFKGVVYE